MSLEPRRLLTNFDTVPAKVETRKHHLSQTKSGAESGEETDRQYAQNVQEEDNQNTVDESKGVYRVSQDSNGEC